jgi:myo-inositol-1(or 4)-monophosphatase
MRAVPRFPPNPEYMSQELDLPKLTSIALATARTAAEWVARGYRSRPSYERKASDADLVTRFDVESEQLIRQKLGELTPDIPIVGEEQGGEPESRPTWFVDPIDGTVNFAHGLAHWGVSIGLMHNNTPLLGAVVAPALQCEWYGYVGGGAQRNGQPCSVTRESTLSDALLGTGFSPVMRRLGHPEDNLAAFCRVSPHVRDIRRCGSAALDLCMVADGSFDGYWERRLSPWDVAAGSALVLAAGGTITSLTGGAFDPSRGYFLASNGKIHDKLIELLALDGRPTWFGP